MTRRMAVLVLAGLAVAFSRADDPKPLELSGHEGVVGGVTFVGEGKVLASAGADKTVRLWDAGEGTELAVLKGHAGKVVSVAATADGKLLASGSDDGEVLVWDVSTRKVAHTLKGQKGDAAAVVFSPDGKLLAVGGGGFDKAKEKSWGEIRLWDVAAGKGIATVDCGAARVGTLAVSPDGTSLAACSSDGTVTRYATATGKALGELGKHPNGGGRAVFSPDGKTVACSNAVRSLAVKVWDVETGKETRSVEADRQVSAFALAFLPDGKTLAIGGMDIAGIRDNTTRGAYLALWDVEKGKERTVLKGHWRAIMSVVVSPDGSRLAAAGMDGTVRVWDLPKPKGK